MNILALLTALASGQTGYRTYAAALLQIIAGVIAQTDWVSFIANPKAGLVAIGSGVVMAAMRSITTTPPGPLAPAAAAPTDKS